MSAGCGRKMRCGRPSVRHALVKAKSAPTVRCGRPFDLATKGRQVAAKRSVFPVPVLRANLMVGARIWCINRHSGASLAGLGSLWGRSADGWQGMSLLCDAKVIRCLSGGRRQVGEGAAFRTSLRCRRSRHPRVNSRLDTFLGGCKMRCSLMDLAAKRHRQTTESVWCSVPGRNRSSQDSLLQPAVVRNTGQRQVARV